MQGEIMRHFIATIAILSAIFATSAVAKPPKQPHEPRFAQPTPTQTELPRIKGIAPEIFANASEEAQIRALQIEANMRDERHKATQKYRDEREKLELQKRILQVKYYHAKAKNDATSAQTLLNQIYQNEQSLSLNRLAERESRDKYEAQKIERIYNELRK